MLAIALLVSQNPAKSAQSQSYPIKPGPHGKMPRYFPRSPARSAYFSEPQPKKMSHGRNTEKTRKKTTK
jgi:hypothetical protein